jgi:hypothetical protein
MNDRLDKAIAISIAFGILAAPLMVLAIHFFRGLEFNEPQYHSYSPAVVDSLPGPQYCPKEAGTMIIDIWLPLPPSEEKDFLEDWNQIDDAIKYFGQFTDLTVLNDFFEKRTLIIKGGYPILSEDGIDKAKIIADLDAARKLIEETAPTCHCWRCEESREFKRMEEERMSKLKERLKR